MRKLPEILRLNFELKLSQRQISTACDIARSTVADYLYRFEQAGLSWPEAAGLNESALERAPNNGPTGAGMKDIAGDWDHRLRPKRAGRQ